MPEQPASQRPFRGTVIPISTTAPTAVTGMVADLSTRLSGMSIAAVAAGKLHLETGDHVATQVELAKAGAYREAAELVLTIARNF